MSSAIREREEAVEASARLKVMREDAAKFRGELQERRRLKHSVSVCVCNSLLLCKELVAVS